MKILYNARIYTLDARQAFCTAIAINDGKILAVGNDYEILKEFGNGMGMAMPAELEDLGNRVIIPGLIDAHFHLESYSRSLEMIDCEVPTRDECLWRVAERARLTPPGAWIRGHGWNQNNWERGFGTAEDLDAAAPDHPVFLTAKSLHAAWMNSAGLRLAGIDSGTVDPPGGRFSRDAEGNPNGILFESAMDYGYNAMPQPTVDEVIRAIRFAQPALWRLGLTGIHDYDKSRCFSALEYLQLNGELGIRVVKGIPLEDLPQAIELGLRSGFGDDFLRIGSIKAFADGALGPQTAAMILPYEAGDAGNERGILLMDGEEFYENGRLAVDHGLSMAVHAIGDRAVHEMLNGYEHLRNYEQNELGMGAGLAKPALRHRIEHVQLLHPDDVGRLATLGIIASMQPIHATSDMKMADRYWGKRASLSYAWRAQLDQGAVLALGSDAPVESPNPFFGIHAAVTRRRLDGTPGSEGWYPEQRLTVIEALQGFTSGPAYAAGLEDRLGRLAPGCLADLLILETDPFTCPPDQLASILPVRTMVAGDWVWGL
jgi:predicted amidohydrolase YtcJ